MIQPVLLVEKLDKRAELPVRSTDLAAGLDVKAFIKGDQDVKFTLQGEVTCYGLNMVSFMGSTYFINLTPGSTALIRTGIRIGIPEGHAVFAFGRSGLGIKQGLRLGNSVGLIDEDYPEELFVGIHNDSNETKLIRDGDRIAQLVCVPISLPTLVESDPASFDAFIKAKSSNRTSGFGSTGS